MTERVMLDTGPLGRIAHANARPDIIVWFRRVLDSGAEVIVPEICDYELRRSLLLNGLHTSIAKLDELEKVLTYAPLTTVVMRRASELWAKCRAEHRPSSAQKALDGDVILAAQAEAMGAVVATENSRHLAHLVHAFDWRDA